MHLSVLEYGKDQYGVVAGWRGLKSLFGKTVVKSNEKSVKQGLGIFCKSARRLNSALSLEQQDELYDDQWSLIPLKCAWLVTVAWVFTLVLMIFPVLALSVEKSAKYQSKIISIDFKDLSKVAAKYGIKLVDFDSKLKKSSLSIIENELSNKIKFKKYILKHYINVISVSSDENDLIYILPKGVDGERFKDAKNILKQMDFKRSFDFFSKAKKIQKKILKLPEIIALASLAKVEKGKHIHFERFVNPGSLSSAYSFDVAYNDRVNSMTPYLRNNAPVTGRMEGFTSFSSIWGFVNYHADKLSAYRKGNRVYLQLKGDAQSKMMISGTSGNMKVITQSRMPNGPKLNVMLEGNSDHLKSVAKIKFNKGEIVLVDIGSIR